MRIKDKLMEPVSIAGLVWFRVLFGSIMMWEVYRYFSKGWVTAKFVRPAFLFKFYGFDWLPDIPGGFFYTVWALLGIFAFCITIGIFYRISIILFTILFSYIFLIEQANYLNHFYFVCLVSFAMCFIDPHRALSLDSTDSNFKASSVVPYWQHLLLCFLMGVVYFFGGVAKIDPDWMTGVPLNFWLDVHRSVPVIGKILKDDTTALVMSWIGVFLDLFIVPLLIFKRTRLIGFLAIAFFHLSNHFLFHIGIFPWFSLATTLLFFGPDFPVRILKNIGLARFNPLKEVPASPVLAPKAWVRVVLILFVGYNVLMPLRHHLYPGDVHWNERGHLFSWRMKLRSKGGPTPIFHIKNLVTGEEWKEKATKRLTRKQASSMKTRPEMIVQYVRYLRKSLKQEGHEKVRITVDSRVSLNNRPLRPMITPNYDMADVEDCVFCVPEWITKPEVERSWPDSYSRLKLRLAKSRQTNLRRFP